MDSTDNNSVKDVQHHCCLSMFHYIS